MSTARGAAIERRHAEVARLVAQNKASKIANRRPRSTEGSTISQSAIRKTDETAREAYEHQGHEIHERQRHRSHERQENQTDERQRHRADERQEHHTNERQEHHANERQRHQAYERQKPQVENNPRRNTDEKKKTQGKVSISKGTFMFFGGKTGPNLKARSKTFDVTGAVIDKDNWQNYH